MLHSNERFTIRPNGLALPELDSLCSPNMAVSTSVESRDITLFPERARTDGALYAQYNIHEDSIEGWMRLSIIQKDQPLSFDTYRDLANFSRAVLYDTELYRAMEVINAAHDIFKNHDHMQTVGLNPARSSHDEGMQRLFLPEHHMQLEKLLPSFASCTDRQKRIIEGTLTARFNFARFLESQLSADEMASFDTLPQKIRALVILHGIHDIAGAMGHKNVESSLTLNEPTATRLLDAAWALLDTEVLGFEPQELNATTRQAAYLAVRAHRIGLTLPAEDRLLESPDALAYITLANFLRVDTPIDLVAPLIAYTRLPESFKKVWRQLRHRSLICQETSSEELDPQGLDYAPAFLRTLASNGDHEALYHVLGYFTQVMAHAALLTPSSDMLNLYPMTQWLTKRKGPILSPIPIIFERHGATVTPVPIDKSYAGDETPILLFPADALV